MNNRYLKKGKFNQSFKKKKNLSSGALEHLEKMSGGIFHQ